MKRGFLFGLGSFLGMGVLAGLMHLSTETTTATIVVAILVPLSILAFRAANRAPPNCSRAHAVVAWLAGVLTIAMGLPCIGAIIVVLFGLRP